MASAKKRKKTDVSPEQRQRTTTPWVGDGPPWELYSQSGIAMIEESGDREIVRILEIGGGKVKMTEPKLSEKTRFEYGGGSGTTDLFGASQAGDVLLDEDVKLRAMEMSYKFDREDPLYHAIIQAYLNFIVGKGVSIKARDENPAVQAYLDKWWAADGMDGKDAAWIRRYLKTGELALRFYETDKEGRKASVPRVRAIPFWRVVGITTSPDDAEQVVSYKIGKSGPGTSLASLVQSQAETVPASEIMMWHNGDPEELRGEPPFLSIMRSVKWYADWLLNRVVLNRYRTAHVLFKKVKGSPARTTSVSTNTPNAASHSGIGGKLEKRLPQPGTMVTHNENIEYTWKSPDLGAGDAAEDGHGIRRNIAAGAQVPEFVLGDASTANYASTLVSQNPFVRQVEFYQDVFSSIFGAVCSRIIRHGIATGAVEKTSWETTAKEAWAIGRTLRKALLRLGLKEDQLGDLGSEQTKRRVPTKTETDCQWPTLVQADALKDAQTLQIHQAMGAASVESIREKLGYNHEVEEQRTAREGKRGGDEYDAARDGELAAAVDDDDDAAAGPGQDAAAQLADAGDGQ